MYTFDFETKPGFLCKQNDLQVKPINRQTVSYLYISLQIEKVLSEDPSMTNVLLQIGKQKQEDGDLSKISTRFSGKCRTLVAPTLPKLDHSRPIYLQNLFDEQVVGSVRAEQRHICHKFLCCLRLCMTQTYESIIRVCKYGIRPKPTSYVFQVCGTFEIIEIVREKWSAK